MSADTQPQSLTQESPFGTPAQSSQSSPKLSAETQPQSLTQESPPQSPAQSFTLPAQSHSPSAISAQPHSYIEPGPSQTPHSSSTKPLFTTSSQPIICSIDKQSEIPAPTSVAAPAPVRTRSPKQASPVTLIVVRTPEPAGIASPSIEKPRTVETPADIWKLAASAAPPPAEPSNVPETRLNWKPAISTSELYNTSTNEQLPPQMPHSSSTAVDPHSLSQPEGPSAPQPQPRSTKPLFATPSQPATASVLPDAGTTLP